MPSPCVFPEELVGRILSYTNPLDVIRWRTVSKWFCAITRELAIWKALHANLNIPFIRSPSPFPSQSIPSLERKLVRSLRLAQSWTTQPLRILSHAETPLSGTPKFKCHTDSIMVDGGWLVVCQLDHHQFVLCDTSADAEKHPPQILLEEKERISKWQLCSRVSKEGVCVGNVFWCKKHFPRSWRLMEFSLDGESGALRDVVALDVPISSYPSLTSGIKSAEASPFLYISDQDLVFATGTHIFYKFPKFHLVLDETRRVIDRKMKRTLGYAVLTETHVFRCFYFERQDSYLIQAFTVPDDEPSAGNGVGLLRLSHEGISSRRLPYYVIRNSVVDPITGSMSIRFLEWSNSTSGGGHPVCIDVTLHKASSNDVSLITVHSHDVLTNKNRRLRLWPPDDQTHWWRASGDGYGRGLMLKGGRFPEFEALNDWAVKYAIDATGDCCVLTLGEYSPVPEEWKHFHRKLVRGGRMSHLFLDCIGGILHFVRFNKGQATLVVMHVE